jgi:hypothetical protein
VQLSYCSRIGHATAGLDGCRRQSCFHRTGVLLEVALPTVVSVFTREESKVAEAWAINGAFSVAGSALAALAGLTVGSHGLAILAIPCYTIAWAVFVRENRLAVSSSEQASPIARAV